jgi:hypothetical protein
MKFKAMPKPRHLKGFGIVIFLAALISLFWKRGTISSGKPNSASDDAIPHLQDDSLRRQQDASSGRRVAREVNAEARVRSLLQIAPGEAGSIHIPASGIASLLSDEKKKTSEQIPVVPITREQAVRGLEEILRHGDSLGSKVGICEGKITWKGEGIAINGEMTESGDDLRNLHFTIEGSAANGFPQKSNVSMSIKGYSFFLALAPDPGAGGVLLIFGEDTRSEE